MKVIENSPRAHKYVAITKKTSSQATQAILEILTSYHYNVKLGVPSNSCLVH